MSYSGNPFLELLGITSIHTEKAGSGQSSWSLGNIFTFQNTMSKVYLYAKVTDITVGMINFLNFEHVPGSKQDPKSLKTLFIRKPQQLQKQMVIYCTPMISLLKSWWFILQSADSISPLNMTSTSNIQLVVSWLVELTTPHFLQICILYVSLSAQQ